MLEPYQNTPAPQSLDAQQGQHYQPQIQGDGFGPFQVVKKFPDSQAQPDRKGMHQHPDEYVETKKPGPVGQYLPDKLGRFHKKLSECVNRLKFDEVLDQGFFQAGSQQAIKV